MSDSTPAIAPGEQAQPNHQKSQTEEATEFPQVEQYKRQLARCATDADACMGLLQAVKQSGSDKLLYESYAAVLKQYPSSGHLLSAFVELELSRGNKESAESVFNNNLFNVPSIELWQCYLNYVLKANVDPNVDEIQQENRATVMDCYKLVLENVGCDREAGQIWIDYISFIESAQAHAPYEEQQKTDLLRETYQAAVAIPMIRVEDIWKKYDAFENQIDRMSAKQLLSKSSPAYMTARTALREMNRFWDAIESTKPPYGLPQPPGWTPREVEHLDVWKKYLEWEVSNPLMLSDVTTLQQRVIHAYDLACMDIRFYPEIWIEFAEYLASLGRHNEALAKFQTASSVLPTSLAVQFAYAEMAERMKQLDICKQTYEHVVRILRQGIESITTKYSQKLEKLERKLEQPSNKKKPIEVQGAAVSNTEAADAETNSESDENDFNDDDEPEASDTSMGSESETEGLDSAASQRRAAQRAAKLRRSIEQRIARTKTRKEAKLEERREAYTLGWIMYLRYTQRSEGIDAVRQLLRRPRSEPAGYLTYHLYVAAALMEYHVAKRPGVAAKLFEYYAKTFSDSSEYIMEYMNYLISSGDDTNVRALFERFHGTNIGKANDIWTMFADFEYNYGDMAAISKLDKRFIDKFEHESVLTRMANRYSYLNVDCVAVTEFGFPYRKDMPLEGSVVSSRMQNGNGRAKQGEEVVLQRSQESTYADNDLPNIAVASITGHHLNKDQLLAPVTPGRFAEPSTEMLKEYAPTIEPFIPEESTISLMSGASSDFQSPSTSSILPQFRSLLDNGDVLSYVAASVAAPNTFELNNYPLNNDALLAAVMDFSGMAAETQSQYRPLSYMPWLARAENHHMHNGQPKQPSYHKHDRGGGMRSYDGRSQSRGRSADSDSHRGSHGYAPRHGARGGYAPRHAPYPRTPSYGTGDVGRPPFRGGSARAGSRFNRSGSQGRA
ncbi:mRNA 3'-end-processing protein rna14 [Coemansia sp. RSA 1365]|nr:mRNA 3'-end-processing protein rna14 [Coemansia sp. RSA 1365]